jgi:glutathione S-transferase
MYKLHIANKNYSSWSLRPWVLMRELGIPFQEILHPFAETGNWVEFRHFSPSGKVPCLVAGDTVVWDSLAIAEYLAEDHPQVWPENKAARAWARSASAEMHSGFQALRNNCSMSCGVRIKISTLSPALQKDIARIDELWCEGLQLFGGPFLAGKKFTAVDAFYAPVAFRIQSYGLSLSPAATTYWQYLIAQDAMQEWYKSALNETWREPSHEQDIAAAGSLIHDFRLK